MKNINETIKQLRTDANMTQDQLAEKLGVSRQAVSQWETGFTLPDVALLPTIADTFGVTIDALFGREAPSPTGYIEDIPADDGKIRALVFIGSKMVSSKALDSVLQNSSYKKHEIVLNYQGEAKDIESHFSVTCGAVAGSVKCGHSVDCNGAVGGSITAGHSINCGMVGASVTAGHSITCGEIGGSTRAGHSLSCSGNIGGDVTAGTSVSCKNIYGKVKASKIDCSSIKAD